MGILCQFYTEVSTMKERILILAFLIACIASISSAEARDGKFLSMFEIVNFENAACDGDTKNGTCYTSAECEKKGGDDAGSCAEGYGVCCTFKVKCGETIAENITYFESTGDEDGACSIKVCPVSDNICQLRLDFSTFSITGPNTNTGATTDQVLVLNGEMNAGGLKSTYSTRCTTDVFTVTNPDGVAPPAICGVNSGEHMYVDASQSCNDLSMQLASDGSQMWTITVSQYECGYENLAPPGCTQYYWGSNTGVIKTYNYQSGSGTGHHLADQNQVICIRRETGNSKICYTTAAAIDFEVSGKGDAIAAMVSGKVAGCCMHGADGKSTVGYDCLLIPSPTNLAIAGGFGAFCGGVGLVTADGAKPLNDATTLKTVCSKSMPFMVTFLSDGFEVADADTAEAAQLNHGFKLSYIQST